MEKNKEEQTKESNTLWWVLGLSAAAFIGYKVFNK